jgi:carbon-monoxide dehydrogenase medium subunit
MIPVQFDYAAPESLEAAIKLLQEKEGAQILAGGHSLLTQMKLGKISPSFLIDLRKIQSLQGIEIRPETNGVLQIGTMTTYAQTAADPEVKEKYHALAEVANSIGDAQIRNWGRIGDIFAYRNLACDLLAVTSALEARFNIVSPKGNYAVSTDELIRSSFQTMQAYGEIVASIDFPPHVIGTGSAYEKFKHPANGYTICGIAVLVRQSPDGIIDKCHVAATGVTDNTIRLHQVETKLEGKAPTAENVEAAAKLATESLSTTNKVNDILSSLIDHYASTEYRSHLRTILTTRALTRAIERSKLDSQVVQYSNGNFYQE